MVKQKFNDTTEINRYIQNVKYSTRKLNEFIPVSGFKKNHYTKSVMLLYSNNKLPEK